MRSGFRYYFDVELFDLALLYGMTPDDYWFGDPSMLANYAHLYEQKRKEADEKAWWIGQYVLRALHCDPVPVGLIMNEKDLKQLPKYPEQPVRSKSESQTRLSDEEIKQRNIDLTRISYLKAMYAQEIAKGNRQK